MKTVQSDTVALGRPSMLWGFSKQVFRIRNSQHQGKEGLLLRYTSNYVNINLLFARFVIILLIITIHWSNNVSHYSIITLYEVVYS